MTNSDLGLTLQCRICMFFGLQPSETALKQFSDVYNPSFLSDIDSTICKVFKEIGSDPKECVSFVKNPNHPSEYLPYNFILKNGQTVSIRTSKSTNMVAPRIVGQAGFDKFNEKFGHIIDKPVVDQKDIREQLFKHIDKMFPVFLDYLLNSDYTVWVYYEKNKLYFEIINNNTFELPMAREFFTFTRDPSIWTESTSIKYKNLTVAEAQTHKNRSFKFRFNIKNLISLIVKENKTTESIGITAEKAICDVFNLKQPSSFKNRYSSEVYAEIKEQVIEAFQELPQAIKHTGSDSGERKGSKCPYDFILKGNKTLSVKTNKKMVCPPEVGQPCGDTFELYFKDLLNGERISPIKYKELVLEKSDKMLPIYLEHLFDSDFLLWIYERNGIWDYQIFSKNYGSSFEWKKENIELTRKTIEEWNESNTLKYTEISIGEFQVHNNRNCYKFRFNFENLIKLLEEMC